MRLSALLLLSCSGFSPGPFACELYGAYHATALSESSECVDWSAELSFDRQLALACRVPLALDGFTGDVDCSPDSGLVLECSGVIHGERCSYDLTVVRCEKGGCDDE